MNANYFYELGYISPHGCQMYEYNFLDPENKVDFSAFYDEDMWKYGLLNSSSENLINQYKSIPLNGYSNTKIGLEFDCGSVKPATFARLHETNKEINNSIYEKMLELANINTIKYPEIPSAIKIEDIGVYPERETNVLRFLARGCLYELKKFAENNGCSNTNIIDLIKLDAPWLNGISFDWNGSSLSNFTFHSSTLHLNNEWVIDCRKHMESNIAKLLHDRKYSIFQFVKVGLSDNFPDNYMKAYFTVRY